VVQQASLTLCVIILFVLPVEAMAETAVLAPGAPCGVQDYDAEEPPDFTCPGPEEQALRPELHPPDAVSVSRGWIVVDSAGEQHLEVPWDGALVHRDRLIEAGLWLYTVRRLRWADRLRLRLEYDIRLQHAEDMTDVRVELLEEQREAYRERWRASEQRVRSAQVWYRSPVLWFAVGVVVTGGLVALTAYGLSSVN